jgi:tRNA A-37 threonylcarbamoyl transferase component Bud32
MNFKIHPQFAPLTEKIKALVADFGNSGKMLGEAVRNSIKIFDLEGQQVNIKSFRIPGILNTIIYGYIRKSKARRSFEYANKLLENGIGTPQPIAYFENFGLLGLKDSYYVSEQLAADLMYRDLATNLNYPDREEILRQFTRFTFVLHEKGIEFIDNTSGNTLIKKDSEGVYSFYLVDLNRMNFHKSMSFDKRMSNLGKLTNMEDMLVIMSDEYAKLSGTKYEIVFRTLKKEADKFLDNFNRRRRIKKKIKFWKK